MQTTLLLFFSFGALYVVQKLLGYRRAINSIQDHPGYRTLLGTQGAFPNALPYMPGITPGANYLFKNKYRMHQYFGWDVCSSVSAWPKSNAALILADANAIKEVTSSRARFPKPVDQYKILTFFGRNIVASEGDEWKRYRKIAAPAFSDHNNKLVWDESLRIVTDLFQNVWGDKEEISVDHGVEVTLPIALSVISAAGFGRPILWKDDAIVPSGHKMTFWNALHIVSYSVVLKVIVPDWAFGFTQQLREIRLAYDELEEYMKEMIKDRRSSVKEERYDLFSSLLDANEEESASTMLTERELLGNIFVFLLAGHESTAHTLCFSFGLLALYPEEQEVLYKHIKSVLSDGRTPGYEDMPLLTQCMAVFNETLRLFPPGYAIPKRCVEDTSLTIGNIHGEKKVIPVPAGTEITISPIGLHYNPRYWPDPDVFKPSRFLGDWPRDAFIPFSAGARGCIGRKFSETEAIVVLTMLVSRYKIEVKEEPQFADESFEARKERILACSAGVTLIPTRTPLVFKLREKGPSL